MLETRGVLSEIIARSRTLAENLSDAPPAGPFRETAAVRARLERWRASAAGGDDELFQRRLAWDGLTLERVAGALAGALPEPPPDTPPWALLLEEIVREARSWNAAPLRPPPGFPVEADRPLPFEDLWLPAVCVARRRLRHSLGRPETPECQSFAPLLSKEASLSLERSLLGQLTGLAAPALYRDFSSTRPFGMGALALLLPDAAPTGATESYAAFVAACLGDGRGVRPARDIRALPGSRAPRRDDDRQLGRGRGGVRSEA